MFYEALVICSMFMNTQAMIDQQWMDGNPAMKSRRTSVCVEIAEKAEESGIDPMVAVALGFEESGFQRNLKSKRGAVGPMQIQTHHHCPKRRRAGCDLVQGGIDAMKKIAHMYGCGESHKRKSKELRHKSRDLFIKWALDTPICDDPDWLTIVGHYNSGNAVKDWTFPKKVMRRLARMRAEMDKMPHNEEVP